MMIDSRIISAFHLSDGRLDLKLTEGQKINVMPNNITFYSLQKGARKFSWSLTLSNIKTAFEKISGAADLIFLFSNHQKIKVVELKKGEELLLNSVSNLLLWTDGIEMKTHVNTGLFRHSYFVTKIYGAGTVVFKYTGTIHEIDVQQTSDRRLYIEPSSLFLFDKTLNFKTVTVGKGFSAYWKKKLLRVEGEGKLFVIPSENSLNGQNSRLDVLEDVPVIGAPISIFNKLTRR
jgi:uncharacterized protein (AIM24 family)